MEREALPARAATWSGLRAPAVVPALLVAIVLLGGLLRLYRLTALSLWLDEGFTVHFARLPWRRVIGLEGQYDPHPPLYYAIIKAASIPLPELWAGRVVSAVAGIATLAVLYLLVARLVNRAAGLLAALALALSPVHVWYSQEARQYTLMTLAIAGSYLALVLCYQQPSWRHAILYGVSILAAMYIEYSALFALLPQIPQLALIAYRHRRSALPLAVGAGGAALGYLPWVPEVIESTRNEGTDRAWYLGVSTERVMDSIWSLTGFHGQGLYFWGGPTPWDRWPGLHPAFALLVLAVVAAGGIALIRRSWLAFAAVAGITAGTVGLAATLSLISPAYAERTILPVVLGWCALLGAAPFVTRVRAVRIALLGLVGATLLFSLMSLRAIQQGDKQHWDELAAATEAAVASGEPLITSPAITATLIDLYAPAALDGTHVGTGGLGPLNAEARALLDTSDAIWLAYIDSAESAHVRGLIEAEGFQRLTQQQFRDKLYLDLYTREVSAGG